MANLIPRTRLNNDQSAQVDDMHGMLHNAFGVVDGGGGGECDGVDLSSLDNDNSCGGDENYNGGDREILNDDARRFYNLLKDVEQELYPGCDDAPIAPSETEKFQQMSLVKVTLGKHSLNTPVNKRKRDDVDKEYDVLWKKKKVLQLYHQGDLRVNEDLKWLAQEPLILASQGIQVFYVEDPVDTEWHAVVFTKPRDLYDMDEVANVGDLYVENESGNTENLQALMDNTYDVRDDLPRIMLDSPSNIMEEGDTEDQYGDETDN
ncbi:hypothetical protein QYF36_017871 [Acer negundo]|nr:hypothetical protein QYF36_017871 [Acer negundo]